MHHSESPAPPHHLESASLDSKTGALARVSVIVGTVMVLVVTTVISTFTTPINAQFQKAPVLASAKVSQMAWADRVALKGEIRTLARTSTKNETRRLQSHNRVAERKAESTKVRTKVVKFAKAQIGDPYRAGHSGPNAFDCSGLVRYVFKKITGKELPHFSKAQYRHAKKIGKKNAKPGDLVFFFENGAHHVGIYIGNGKMVDAPNAGGKVRVSPITGSWWGRSFTGMGRLLPA